MNNNSKYSWKRIKTSYNFEKVYSEYWLNKIKRLI